jgi:prepilin-type N-terminal cleavage/methylation domain-containing protein
VSRGVAGNLMAAGTRRQRWCDDWTSTRRRRGRASTRESVGFTLIELMIVIIIIGIAAAIAVPMMSSAASFQIRAAANIVAADLEYAKSMAISRGKVYSVVFDSANDTYQVEDPNGNIIRHPTKKGATDYYVVDFHSDSRLDRVDLVSANFDGTSTVKFNYLGSPFNGSDTDLNSGTIRLEAGDAGKTITVEPVTGYVSLSD